MKFSRLTMGAVLTTILLGGWLDRGPILRWWSGLPVADPNQALIRAVRQIDFPLDGTMEHGAPTPWVLRSVRGSTMSVASVIDEGRAALELTSRGSHYLLYNGSKTFDPKEFPIVCWSWKAKTLPTRGDVRTCRALPLVGDNRNDKAAQVLVGFEGDNVLMYVWDTTAPVGTEVEELSPIARVMTRVVESGPEHVSQWRAYRVNVFDDYVRRYGKPPTKVLGVALQINSNHTASSADVLVGELRVCTP